MAVVGVDEHVWRHTRRGDKYVTVIIDLTPIRDGTGPARLLDMVEGRSKQAFKTWLAERPQAWRDGVEVVAMDGFTGFKTASSEELPDAVAVMDPFHVVRLAGDALDQCRRRVQQAIHGHRGRKDDPLYSARRTLHTGADLLTDKQRPARGAVRRRRPRRGRGDLGHLPADDRRLPRARPAPWPRADGEADRVGQPRRPRRADRDHHARPDPEKRAADVLAYFDRPGTSNGPTEAINGRLEHLRGSALGFRNLTNYIARSLLETGGFRPQLHPRL